MASSTTARALHDLGAAAWFGGSLMGAVGLNGAAAKIDQTDERARISSIGWARWAPVNATFIGAHLLGGALLVKENGGRLKGQKGVAGWTVAKTGLTGAALVATALSGRAGVIVGKAGDVPAAGSTEALPQTPPEQAAAMKQLKALQWLIPALTGGVILSSSRMGEQQRPAEVLTGSLRRAGQASVAAGKHPLAAVRATS